MAVPPKVNAEEAKSEEDPQPETQPQPEAPPASDGPSESEENLVGFTDDDKAKLEDPGCTKHRESQSESDFETCTEDEDTCNKRHKLKRKASSGIPKVIPLPQPQQSPYSSDDERPLSVLRQRLTNPFLNKTANITLAPFESNVLVRLEAASRILERQSSEETPVPTHAPSLMERSDNTELREIKIIQEGSTGECNDPIYSNVQQDLYANVSVMTTPAIADSQIGDQPAYEEMFPPPPPVEPLAESEPTPCPSGHGSTEPNSMVLSISGPITAGPQGENSYMSMDKCTQRTEVSQESVQTEQPEASTSGTGSSLGASLGKVLRSCTRCWDCFGSFDEEEDDISVTNVTMRRIPEYDDQPGLPPPHGMNADNATDEEKTVEATGEILEDKPKGGNCKPKAERGDSTEDASTELHADSNVGIAESDVGGGAEVGASAYEGGESDDTANEIDNDDSASQTSGFYVDGRIVDGPGARRFKSKKSAPASCYIPKKNEEEMPNCEDSGVDMDTVIVEFDANLQNINTDYSKFAKFFSQVSI